MTIAAADAFGACGGDEARHLRRRCGDDDDIRRVGQVRNAFDCGDAFNLAVARIDELNGSGKSARRANCSGQCGRPMSGAGLHRQAPPSAAQTGDPDDTCSSNLWSGWRHATRDRAHSLKRRPFGKVCQIRAFAPITSPVRPIRRERCVTRPGRGASHIRPAQRHALQSGIRPRHHRPCCDRSRTPSGRAPDRLAYGRPGRSGRLRPARTGGPGS